MTTLPNYNRITTSLSMKWKSDIYIKHMRTTIATSIKGYRQVCKVYGENSVPAWYHRGMIDGSVCGLLEMTKILIANPKAVGEE